jgi:hypothetical protein
MLSHPPTRDLMAFTPGEEALLALDAGYAEPSASSRLDSFFDNHTGSLQFVEYNAESPAGMAYEDELSEVFQSLPVMVNLFYSNYPLDSAIFSMLKQSLKQLASILNNTMLYGGKINERQR